MNKFGRIVISADAERFLVLHNMARNRWEFPGGKVEPEENTFEAANRETTEEIGVEITGSRFICQKEIHAESGGWIGDFYFATSYSGTPKILEPHKHDELRWVTLDELLGLPQIPLVASEVLRHVLQE